MSKVKISDLTPDDKNYNKGTQFGNSLIEKSLRKFGAGRSILLDKNNRIIAGNKTIENAYTIGLDDVLIVETTGNQIVAVKRMDIDLDSKIGRELALADNAAAKANIEWDYDNIQQDWEIAEQEEWGIDNSAFVKELEAEEDDFDTTLPLEPITVLGDLYEIGEHRLLCGDSTDSDAVAKLMNGKKADMVFTDPPYNIGFKGSMSNKIVNGKKAPADSANQRHDEIKNDAMTEEQFYKFISDIIKEIKINCLGAYYICFGSQTLNQLLQPLSDLGIEYKSIIIWMKNQAIFSGKDFKSRYEPIVYGRFNDFFNGARFNEEDIWEFARTQKNDLHPTMKPIPLIENALNYSSKEGMNILDLFLGSGSTMVASHQLKRKCYGMELDPKYCDVIVNRMIALDPDIEIKLNGKPFEKAY
jgi:site-specific DNA-methyltransferase (adenine-specific)